MKSFFLCFQCLLLSYFSFSQPNVDLELVATGFEFPVHIKNAGDERLFVVERLGAIKILNSDGTVNLTPFLDIDALVIEPGGIANEGGLLGLAFHPDYSSNGYFYVNYVSNTFQTVIARYTVSPGDPNIADPNSEFILLTITQPELNHNGGELVFGADGYLYIGTGDGGGIGDPNNHGQNLNSLLGKILRIDVDGGTPYGIPSTNPFFLDGDPNSLDEIWAYGLRNPWRFSFDSLTSDLWIADVGQDTTEEINMTPFNIAGLNYGWRCYEGSLVFNNTNCPIESTLTYPVAEYTHSGNGVFKCSVTSGLRYRGTEFPNLNGIYIFADFCSDEIGVLEFADNSWNMDFIIQFGEEGFTGFGEDINNEIYVSAMKTGSVYKVIEGALSLSSSELVSVRIYPNPTEDVLNFQFENSLMTSIEIMDMQGKLIKWISVGDEQLITLSTSQFAKGLYIARVLDANGHSTIKKLVLK